jgi:hypothetical protein
LNKKRETNILNSEKNDSNISNQITELFQTFVYENSDDKNIFKKKIVTNEKINKRDDNLSSSYHETPLRYKFPKINPQQHQPPTFLKKHFRNQRRVSP